MDTKKPPFDDDDPDAPVSEEERVLSDRLRDALADPRIENAEADLARALSLGFEPREIEKEEHRIIVEGAVAKVLSRPPRGNVIRVAFGLGAALALAAGAFLGIGRLGTTEAPLGREAAAAMLQARSTQPLFEEPFARSGGASARIDRIAMARSWDLRENRFATWGVR